MKREHRKELHTNVLADRMGRLLQGMKSAPQSSSLIWVFLLLTLLTHASWQFYASTTRSNRSGLWVQLDEATRDPEDASLRLAAFANKNQGSIPGRTARFELARIRLQEGQENLTSFHRSAAVNSIIDARKLYEKLATECPDSPLLAQEALMGVAKAEESLVGIMDPDKEPPESYGSLERALEFYHRLASKYPNSVLGQAAAKRADELEEEQTLAKVQAFYDELNKLAGPVKKTETKAP